MQIPVEAEVITEEASGDPEDQDADASAHPEVTKYRDAEESSHPEVPKDLDADTRSRLEVYEDHDAGERSNNEVQVAGSIYDVNTQKKTGYVGKINLDVEKNDKMIIIHGGTSMIQLMHPTL